MQAPLLISGTILQMSDKTLKTYTNPEVIKVSQDSLGIPGVRVAGGNLYESACYGGGSVGNGNGNGSNHGKGDRYGGGGGGGGTFSVGVTAACTNVWARKLDGQPGKAALVFLNAGGAETRVSCDAACWSAAGYTAADFPLEVADLWTGKQLPMIESPDYTTSALGAHGGVSMLQVISYPTEGALPHLQIPACGSSAGYAVAEGFRLDTAPAPRPLAEQQTQVLICHDPHGLHFKTNATDVDIFNSATKCNDPVFAEGDVLEVFISPVEQLTDVPEWYLEIDTAATSGALWGMLAHNPLNGPSGPNIGGNATAGISCDVAQKDGYCSNACNASRLMACMFKCTGRADFVNGMNVNVTQGDGWWGDELFIPWTMFPAAGGVPTPSPWKLWRLNLYRYDYWRKDGNSSSGFDRSNEELSAWSTSGEGNFHMPQFFGSAELV